MTTTITPCITQTNLSAVLVIVALLSIGKIYAVCVWWSIWGRVETTQPHIYSQNLRLLALKRWNRWIYMPVSSTCKVLANYRCVTSQHMSLLQILTLPLFGLKYFSSLFFENTDHIIYHIHSENIDILCWIHRKLIRKECALPLFIERNEFPLPPCASINISYVIVSYNGIIFMYQYHRVTVKDIFHYTSK